MANSSTKEHPMVVLSVGYGQTHMYRCAEMLNEDDRLRGLISSGYPPEWLRVAWPAPLRRLTERRVNVDPQIVNPIWGCEALWQIGAAMEGSDVRWAYQIVNRGRRWYAMRAGRNVLLNCIRGDVYHFRSGFGGESVFQAKRQGLVTVCDHSIAHPAALADLLSLRGSDRARHDAVWAQVEGDLRSAHHIVVNSHFVADTCARNGIREDRMTVAYTATDEPFLAHLRALSSSGAKHVGGPRNLRVLYAGTVEHRKGADTLAQAILDTFDLPIEYRIVGSWMPDAASLRTPLKRLRNVTISPKLPRDQLAKEMAESDVLVLPTRAEGSARVLAEAMSAGMFVITTNESGISRDAPSSGSIRMEPGRPDLLAGALRLISAARPMVVAGGEQNRAWALGNLNERVYYESILRGYERARAVA